MRQATVLLMCGGAIPASRCTLSKFVGLRQSEMIRQQSCRTGFSMRTCVDLAHTGQAYSAADLAQQRGCVDYRCARVNKIEYNRN